MIDIGILLDIHFYKYKKAKEENDSKTAKKELFNATFIIFLIHGCWDALLSFISYFANSSKIANNVLKIIACSNNKFIINWTC